MILYQYPGLLGLGSVSPPCLKVWLALRRLGVEHRVVDILSGGARKVSRTGRLPVLELDDGTRVCESVTILDELERLHPQADLFAREPLVRVHDRLWDHYATDALYWFGFYFRWVHPETAERTFRAFFGRRSPLVRLIVRATFSRRARLRGRLHGVGGLAPETVERCVARAFETIETGLEGGPFLGGRETPGRGDLACASVTAQIGLLDTMPPVQRGFARHPALRRHAAAVFEACDAAPPKWLAS